MPFIQATKEVITQWCLQYMDLGQSYVCIIQYTVFAVLYCSYVHFCWYVGPNVLGDVSRYSLEELTELGIGKDVSLDWEDSLHTALMPMTPCRSIESVLERKLLYMVMLQIH